MFKMGGAFSIRRHDRPAIRKNPDPIGSLVHHRLQGQNHAFLQSGSLMGGAKIWNLRVLMEIFSDPVPDEISHDRKSMGFHPSLNGVGNIEKSISDLGLFNADRQSFLRYFKESFGLRV